MDLHQYEPLVRQLCRGIFDPHLRSAAEQEGRIRLWVHGAKVDSADNPDALANQMIRSARKDAWNGRLWTGEGKGHNRKCDHGPEQRTPRGECRPCKSAREKRQRVEKREAAWLVSKTER